MRVGGKQKCYGGGGVDRSAAVCGGGDKGVKIRNVVVEVEGR